MNRADFYIIGTILLLALIGTMILKINSVETNKIYAEIYVSGELLHRVLLSSGHDYILIENGGGGYNLIIITGEGVYVTEANCRSQTCVRLGKHSRPGQIIACLPNRVLIKLVGYEEGGVDAVAY